MKSQNQIALTEAVYYILISLFQPMHGYGIIKNVEEMSHQRVKLGSGTLYGALNTLQEKEWITVLSQNGERNKKMYQISETGREIIRFEIQRLKELLNNGKRIVGGKDEG